MRSEIYYVMITTGACIHLSHCKTFHAKQDISYKQPGIFEMYGILYLLCIWTINYIHVSTLFSYNFICFDQHNLYIFTYTYGFMEL